MAIPSRHNREVAAMADPDKLAETREMVAAQQVSIKNLSDGQARIETEVKDLRIENTAQHQGNQNALKSIYRLAWGIIISGFVFAMSLAGYLANTDGGPWVSKHQYEADQARGAHSQPSVK